MGHIYGDRTTSARPNTHRRDTHVSSRLAPNHDSHIALPIRASSATHATKSTGYYEYVPCARECRWEGLLGSDTFGRWFVVGWETGVANAAASVLRKLLRHHFRGGDRRGGRRGLRAGREGYYRGLPLWVRLPIQGRRGEAPENRKSKS